MHCVHIPDVVYPLICRWPLGSLPPLGIVNSAAIKMGVLRHEGEMGNLRNIV